MLFESFWMFSLRNCRECLPKEPYKMSPLELAELKIQL
jgi:hypothetical protein